MTDDVVIAEQSTVLVEGAEPGTVVVPDAPGVIVIPAEPTVVVTGDGGVIVVNAGVGPQGPPGPPGPPGAPGSGGGGGSSSYAEQNYPTPTAEWVLEHNLGFTPAVSTYSSLGVQIRGLVTENGPVRTVVSFYIPVAGRMTLS